MNAEESYTILKNCILEAANNTIPMTKGNKRKKQVPWWSHQLQGLVDKKHKLAHLINRKTTQITKIRDNPRNRGRRENEIAEIEEEIKRMKPIYNKTNALVKRETTKAKTESWKTYINSLNQNTPMKKIWKRFGKINGSKSKAPRHALWHEGRRIHEPADMCEIFGKHLQEVSSDKFYTPAF